MDGFRYPYSFIAIGCFILFSSYCKAQAASDKKHVEVALRMVGHEVLLQAGDSTSRVMPVVSLPEHQYRVSFESDWAVHPDDLVNTVTRVFTENGVADGYILEVQECLTGSVVYSYEIGKPGDPNLVPCRSRDLPRSCYNLVFTLTGQEGNQLSSIPMEVASQSKRSGATYGVIILFAFACAGAAYLLFRKRKNFSPENLGQVRLGNYLFDKQKAELSLGDIKIELTGKEADLLSLLQNTTNTTVERDVILNAVWGDDGDYVGRTLDVFISKLRKKLELDASVKITNIRGVGYKLVVDA